MSAGIVYKNNEWSTYSDVSESNSNTFKLNWDTYNKTDIRLYITTLVGLKLFGTDGPEIGLEPFIRYYGNKQQVGSAHIAWDKELKFGLDLILGCDTGILSPVLPPIRGTWETIYTYPFFDESGYIDINQPPNTPSNPNPPDREDNISRNTNITWNCSDPDNDPLTYDVYFGPSSSPPIKSVNHTSKSYNPSGDLEYNKKYYWKIVAKDNQGHSTPGPIWWFKTECPKPDKPSLKSPDNNVENQPTTITLDWGNVSSATSYILWVDDNSSFSSPAEYSTTSSQKQISGLSEGVWYYWKVKAKNSCGEGSWSGYRKFKTEVSPTTITLYSNKDSYTNSDRPNTNMGSEGNLIVGRAQSTSAYSGVSHTFISVSQLR